MNTYLEHVVTHGFVIFLSLAKFVLEGLALETELNFIVIPISKNDVKENIYDSLWDWLIFRWLRELNIVPNEQDQEVRKGMTE